MDAVIRYVHNSDGYRRYVIPTVGDTGDRRANTLIGQIRHFTEQFVHRNPRIMKAINTVPT